MKHIPSELTHYGILHGWYSIYICTGCLTSFTTGPWRQKIGTTQRRKCPKCVENSFIIDCVEARSHTHAEEIFYANDTS